MIDKNIKNYFLVLFSLIPISIIVGSMISLLNIILIDLSFIIFIIYNKDFKFLKTNAIKYLFILYLYLIFNSLISIDASVGLSRNLGFIRMIVLFAAFNYFLNLKFFLRNILIVWSVLFFIILIDIFLESFVGKNILGFGGEIYGDRIVSFFKDEPIVGGFVNGFYLIIIGFLFNEINNKNRDKILILFFSILFLIAILLTGERSNSIRAAIGLFIFYSIFKEYDFKKKLVYFTSIVILFLIIILNSDYLKSRYIGQIFSYFSNQPIYFKLYKSGFEVFKNYKLFGVGNKNYRVETCKYKESDQNKNKNYYCLTHPHQIYFEILSEHGLLGLILIFYIFYKLIFSKVKETFKNDNYIKIASLIYLTLTFLPLLPSGAFFNDNMLTLFIINLSIFYGSCKNLNVFNQKKYNNIK